jgi:hypothetical protein
MRTSAIHRKHCFVALVFIYITIFMHKKQAKKFNCMSFRAVSY